MTLADYLAKNYLNADASKPDKKSKKRKRKAGKDDGLVIATDDASGWEQKKSRGRDSDSDGPVTVTSARSAEFRKAKTNNWRTLSGEPVSSLPTSTVTSHRSKHTRQTDSDDDSASAADAILASAAAESAARAAAQSTDDAPAVDDAGRRELAMMENGAHAGLTSAAALTAQLQAARMREAEDASDDGHPTGGAAQETIYRDASGRIVNVAMKRAEARAAAAAEERRKLQEAEEARGDVQRAEREKRRDDLAEAKYLTVARYADDVALNREQKEVERWNDPAAGFLENKKEQVNRVTGRPLYRGDFQPNRYGIRPGHKWDGVDRGNGFEKDYFTAQNRRNNVRDLEYQWQMDE